MTTRHANRPSRIHPTGTGDPRPGGWATIGRAVYREPPPGAGVTVDDGPWAGEVNVGPEGPVGIPAPVDVSWAGCPSPVAVAPGDVVSGGSPRRWWRRP